MQPCKRIVLEKYLSAISFCFLIKNRASASTGCGGESDYIKESHRSGTDLQGEAIRKGHSNERNQAIGKSMHKAYLPE